jgi:uncharacterized protein (TIGR02145 family)
MKKSIILFLLVFSCFHSQAQNLSIGDMQSIYKLPNWEAVDTYLNSKGWRFEGSEEQSDDYGIIKWAYKKNEINNTAIGWFVLYLDGIKFKALEYGLSSADRHNFEKNSVVNYGFKLESSVVQNDELKTVYKNANFNLTFIVSKKISSDRNETIRSICMERVKVDIQPNLIKPADNITTPTYGTVKDIDGNIYKTVKIGNQEWMAENLNVTKYNDGTLIPVVSDPTIWSNLANPGMCWFKDNNYYNNQRQALYNYYSIETKKLCPVNWHIPSITEWQTLITFLGKDSIAAFQMKSNNGWSNTFYEENINGNNKSGFSAKPSPDRAALYGNFHVNDYNQTTWWSSTLSNARGASCIEIRTYKILILTAKKQDGFSVRCIKN